MERREGPRHIPVELWTQIFCLVAVKQLLILRSVCKSFLSMIDDPDFVSLHLRSFPANLHQTLTLVHINELKDNIRKMFYEIRESNGFALQERVDLDLNLNLNDDVVPCITGSLDGLLLMYSCRAPKEVRLWNPSTRRIRTIPLPNCNYPLSYTQDMGMVQGLASYDSDYKLLYISRVYNHEDNLTRPTGVWVYGLKTHSWTQVNMDNSGIIMATHAPLHALPRTLFFEGALLWIERWRPPSTLEYLLQMVRFDLGTHKFSYYTNFPLPTGMYLNSHNSMLVTLDGGLTLGLCGWADHDHFSIWAAATLDGSGDAYSWVRRCVIPQYPVRYWDYPTVRLSKDEEFISMYISRITLNVFTYNLRTRHFHPSSFISLSDSPASTFIAVDHCAYIQSLIKL